MFTKPTLLINKLKVDRNINRMLEKATLSKVIFRPHFKTHQSAEIAEIFKKNGVDKITVSSVTMAQYFADHLWNDITIAFPVNLLEIVNINELSGKIKLNLLVDSIFSTTKLAAELTNKLGCSLKLTMVITVLV